jgi:hypothetical protein
VGQPGEEGGAGLFGGHRFIAAATARAMASCCGR